MFKIETHLHTKHVSRCGHMQAAEIIAAYKQAGYSAVIATDHYNRTTFDYLGIDPAASCDRIHPFLDGYKRLKEEGEKQGIKVFKGAELRFDESENDYLFYGWKNDILSDPEDVFRMGIANFAPIAKAEGCLIIQAHPYRRGCTPAIACYLDGVEVINTSPRHESYNERAAEYAEQFGLIATSGSDCHRPEDVARGGIITSKVPSDSMEMMRLIRSRDFELIGK